MTGAAGANFMAEHGKALVRGGYRIIPIEPGEKRPAGRLGKDWPSVRATSADVERWSAWPECGVGILCGALGGAPGVVGIDIDVDDAELLEELEHLAATLLGGACPAVDPPRRVGRPGRAMLVYRVESDIRGARVGGRHGVEILGAGRQFVAFGVHPVTLRPYEWTRDPLHETPLADLPTVTQAELEAFLRAAATLLGVPPPGTRAAVTRAPSQHPPPTPDAVRSAADVLQNPGLAYDDWIVRGFALRAAYAEAGLPDDEGRRAWEVFSASSAKNVPAETSKKWTTFQPARTTTGSLFELARQDGWRPPAGLDFNVEKGSAAIHGAQIAEALLEADAARRGAPALRPVPNQRTLQRPEIRVTTVDEHEMIDQAVAALDAVEGVYQRDGVLVHVVRDEWRSEHGVERPKGTPRIAELPRARLREALSRAAYWFKLEKNEDAGDEAEEGAPAKDDPNVVGRGRFRKKRCGPHDRAIVGVMARQQWANVRPLHGIVEAPVLRPDGTVLSEVGWDEATSLLYEPTRPMPTVPDTPSRDDAVGALQQLLEVVVDFPFATPAHRSAWLAGLLTPFARPAFNGDAPLFLVDANVRGSGKTLLADVIGLIACGRVMAKLGNTTDDDEMRKRITAIVLAGDPLVLIDNVAGRLGCAALDAVLTCGGRWRDRILGRSEMTGDLPALAVWYGTGNNVALGADTSRRTLHVRLASPLEHPETRTGFAHANLRAWVDANRPRLVGAALTVLRAFVVAERPETPAPAWGSFEPWSGLVRQALLWLDQADPFDTRRELLESADVDASTRGALLRGLQELNVLGVGLTTARILAALKKAPDDEHETLRGALLELCPSRGGDLPSPKALAYVLRGLRERNVEGLVLTSTPGKEGVRWRVRPAEAAHRQG